MSDSPRFLTVDHVLQIHRRMIDEFGGDPALRDAGLLESAARMPAARFGGRYLHDGLQAMAAAYLYHLCMNHPFRDGNKRTALATAELFLLLNDHSLQAASQPLERMIRGVAEGRTSKAQVSKFFKQHVVSE